jgi:hypothetical protein
VRLAPPHTSSGSSKRRPHGHVEQLSCSRGMAHAAAKDTLNALRLRRRLSGGDLSLSSRRKFQIMKQIVPYAATARTLSYCDARERRSCCAVHL